MNEPLPNPPNLPGLEAEPTLAPPPKVQAPARPRVRPVDRSQLVWCSVDVERLIEEDHPARAIWALTGQLDLAGFLAPIEAVEGAAGKRSLRQAQWPDALVGYVTCLAPHLQGVVMSPAPADGAYEPAYSFGGQPDGKPAP